MKKTGGIFHDRFIVLDYGTANERIFLCGASSKDAGARITSIVEDYGISKYAPVIAALLKNPMLILPQQRGANSYPFYSGISLVFIMSKSIITEDISKQISEKEMNRAYEKYDRDKAILRKYGRATVTFSTKLSKVFNLFF